MFGLKDYYNKLQSHFGWFITAIVLLSIISYLIGLIIEPTTNTGTTWNSVLSNLSAVLIMIGTAGITAAIFQVIIKSTAFMNVLKDTLDVDKRNWSQYSDNKIKDVLKAIKEAKNFVHISYIDEKEKSIKLAKKEFLKNIKMIKDKNKNDLTLEEKQMLDKNYIPEESRITKTILKNGSEITTFEIDVRFFKKGNFVFRIENWTDSKNIIYPSFDYFQSNQYDKRFSDFSFSAIYFNLIKKNKEIDKDRYAKLKIEHNDYDNKKGFGVTFSIDDTFEEDDLLTLSFSITIKDTYTDENLSRIESGLDPKPYSSVASPVGVRKIIIQEEIYGPTQNNYKIRPSVTIDEEYIEPSLKRQSIFYKTYEWTIYYHEYVYEKISYSVI